MLDSELIEKSEQELLAEVAAGEIDAGHELVRRATAEISPNEGLHSDRAIEVRNLMLESAVALRDRGKLQSALSLLRATEVLKCDHTQAHIEIVIILAYCEQDYVSAINHIAVLSETAKANLQIRLFEADCHWRSGAIAKAWELFVTLPRDERQAGAPSVRSRLDEVRRRA